jgi:hypothetical protein
MTLTTVDSSMVHAIGYDDETSELEIVFNSGKIYRYKDVEKEIYEELLASSSKGSFLRGNIFDCYEDYQVRSRRGRS